MIVPLVTREDRIIHRVKFAGLRYASDMTHAITASVYRCGLIVAYDHHFGEIGPILPWKTSEDLPFMKG